MTTITKFFKSEDGLVARGVTYFMNQSRLAIQQHLALCQVVADAIAHNENQKR